MQQGLIRRTGRTRTHLRLVWSQSIVATPARQGDAAPAARRTPRRFALLVVPRTALAGTRVLLPEPEASGRIDAERGRDRRAAAARAFGFAEAQVDETSAGANSRGAPGAPADVPFGLGGAISRVVTSGVLGAIVGGGIGVLYFAGIGELLISGAIGALAGFVAGAVNAVAAASPST